MAKMTATLRHVKMSARKMRLVANLIARQNTDKALIQLSHSDKEAARHLKGLLMSAIANAKNNFNVAEDNLKIEKVIVGEGPTLKRWIAASHGKANPILKRSCHVEIELVERVKGKTVKAAKKSDDMKVTQVATKDEVKKLSAESDEAKASDVKKEQVKTGATKKGGLLGKVFRRKSI